MDIDEFEKEHARARLNRICEAVRDFPDYVSPLLQETDLLELLRLADFAERDLVFTASLPVGTHRLYRLPREHAPSAGRR